MADFDRLDDDELTLWSRWRTMQKLLLVARIQVAQTGVRERLATRLDLRLDPANPATPTDRAMLMRRAADAIVKRRRAVVVTRLARARLAALLLASRRG